PSAALDDDTRTRDKVRPKSDLPTRDQQQSRLGSASPRVVLYESSGQWRFAYTTSNGEITEGRVGHGAVAASDAQERVEAQLRRHHGVEVQGGWHSDAEGWWTADVASVGRH